MTDNINCTTKGIEILKSLINEVECLKAANIQ